MLITDLGPGRNAWRPLAACFYARNVECRPWYVAPVTEVSAIAHPSAQLLFEVPVFAKLDGATNTVSGAVLPTPSVCVAVVQSRPM
jgi:hypothetical protein